MKGEVEKKATPVFTRVALSSRYRQFAFYFVLSTFYFLLSTICHLLSVICFFYRISTIRFVAV
jgi:hypothetical protein